jgi:hypothetical protein
MPVAPDFPTIPVPTEDPKALLETCNALKRAIEMLVVSGDRVAAHVFVQPDMPDALHIGDLWFCTSASNPSFNVWSADKWIKLSTVPATLELAGPTDFLLHKFPRWET